MKSSAVAAVIFASALAACASVQPPLASAPTQQRWEAIMQQMRADSAAAATRATQVEEKASSSTPSEPPDERMPSGIDLSHFELNVQYNERVQEYIDLYANRHRAVFVSWLKRMGRYRPYVEERLVAAGLPRELVYLPLIESGYEPVAASNASAVGIWQFMSGTARAEGLEISDFIDERRDPFRSTDAAIRHLRGLHEIFGSWYLAAAAYNSGSGRIARLLRDQGYSVKGPDDMFWAVQDALPSETRGYIPGLLAAIIIGEHPDVFGISAPQLDRPLQFETVFVGGSTELSAVARAAGTTIDEIKELNPQFLRGMTPPDHETQVRIPDGSAKTFPANLAKIPSDERIRQLARTHIVKQGETLSGIASRYGTTVEALQRVNRILRPSLVATGRKLTIPSDVPSSAHGTD